MKILNALFSGRMPLWRIFWLIGLPLFVIFYMTTGCAIAEGCSLAEFRSGLFLEVLLFVAGLGVLLTAIPIWLSATNYTGKVPWAASAAMAYVCLSVLMAGFMVSAVIYAFVAYAITGHV